MKKGDTVKLIRGGKIDWETGIWWKRQGLRIGEKYEIKFVGSGYMEVFGGNNNSFSHHPEHFRLVNYESKIAKNYNI